MPNHFSHFVGGVVNGHIDARNSIVSALNRHEIGGVEFRIFDAHRFGTGCSFFGHRVRDITGGYLGAHLCQRNRQASHATPTVAHRLSLDIPIVPDPVQYLLYRLIVSISDVQLNFIDFVRLGVDFIPAIETFVVEVLAHFGLSSTVEKSVFLPVVTDAGPGAEENASVVGDNEMATAKIATEKILMMLMVAIL